MNTPGLLIRITGTVQGVGFRPFVYRAAATLGVRGEVRNEGSRVMIQAFASHDVLRAFVDMLRTQAPPLARIRTIETLPLNEADQPAGFSIADSAPGQGGEPEIAHDTATCDACLREMRDPNDRRYGHPFINCTDCGPRYTLITALPYDRPNTTMAPFALCRDCRKEYEDPADRRFHAQPVCCPACGPRLQLLGADGSAVAGDDPLLLCCRTIAGGGIAAVKGIGGYHLVCRADHADALRALRTRKRRPSKPFALMVDSLDTARRLAKLSAEDERLLESRERPIVLVPARPDPLVAPEVAPNVDTLGIMLPYTPVHHLLFDRGGFRALVMTSGNRSEEPMTHDDTQALRTLAGIADVFLCHDRPIHVRTDDSIARVVGQAPVLLRRARGFVPQPLPSPVSVDGIVAWGGILKSTVTVGKGTDCYVSQYVGALENIETLRALEEIADHLIGITGTVPSLYALDLHPHGLQHGLARDTTLPVEYIQHHHAHAAACMAENQVDGPAVCVVYDGTGFGEDNTSWGGEIFVADYRRCRRVAYWSPLPMPGGDQAALEPWRMALGALYPLGEDRCAGIAAAIPPAQRSAVIELLRAGVSCPLSSSMGRLFDALSAGLGICLKRTYEGQPAIELEGIADSCVTHSYDTTPMHRNNEALVIEGSLTLAEAIEDARSGTAIREVAARFHNTIARATVEASAAAARQAGLDTVCLSGGCFQNALLTQRVVEGLRGEGLRPLVHRRIPPNDEGISYGQAVIAGARRAGESRELP